MIRQLAATARRREEVPMLLLTRLVLSLWIAALLACLDATPALAQGGSPADPPTPPKVEEPPPTPEQLVKDLTEHLRENRKKLDGGTPTEGRPKGFAEGLDWELKFKMEAYACVLGIMDAAGILRRYGRDAYKDKPDKLEEFRKAMKEFDKEAGFVRNQEALRDEALEVFKRILKAKGEDPEKLWLKHELYHLANKKRLTTFHGVGLPNLVKPMALWKGVVCEGDQCVRESPEEKKARGGETLPRTQPR
jgi:hypothetical protein